MNNVPREIIDCGLQDSQYRIAIASVSHRLLLDMSPVSSKAETALIVPAMKSPFPRLLSRRTPFHSIYILDSENENIRWQITNIEAKEKCTFIVGDESKSLDLKDVSFILNPFGLQHYADQSRYFGERVRTFAHNTALLATLDWGVTTYPEDLKDFPGISNEIQHSERLQLPPFSKRDGWEHIKETVFTFFVQHTIDEISTLLTGDHKVQFQRRFLPDRIIEVGSSIVYRLYEAS